MGNEGAMSGTVFKYRGRLITAGHLCQSWVLFNIVDLVEPMRVRSVEGDGELVSGRYVPERFRYDDKVDICVLREVDETIADLMELRRGRAVHVGDPVTIVGAPLGLMLFRTDGYVASLADARCNGWMTTSAAAYGGNSGSPVLDADGALVGMLVAGFPSYPIVSVVVPVAMIDAFLGDE